MNAYVLIDIFSQF